MRSSRAIQLLRNGSRQPCTNARRVQQPSIYKAYCSSCDAKPAMNSKAKVKAVSDPPIPPADHRQLAIDQELFTTSIYSPGSPLFLPNGTRIFNRLTSFLKAQYAQFGFQEVISPTIYKKSLWEKSGHWENYAEDMFSVTGRGASGEAEGKQVGQDEEFGLKPMNCPGHCILFASKQRSFRDMPIRFSDFSPLHRNEISGALSGLTRVRRFHQDDGHIFCRPSQVAEEISKTLDFVQMAYETFKLGPYRLALSTRPKDNYIGTAEEWDGAESALREALDASGQVWSVNEGDGAFYGPKIDIILKDSDGKEHQTATIQLDFQLPKRFELQYTAPAPELEQKGLTTTDPELLAVSGPVRPVMIHRAVLGSVERFMALLIEHYNGRWPFWLNTKQVMVITVNDDPSVVAFASDAINEIQGMPKSGTKAQARGLHSPVFGVDLDTTPRSVKKKISEAMRKHYGIIAVVGKSNVEGGRYITVDFRGVSGSQNVIKQELLDAIKGENSADPSSSSVADNSGPSSSSSSPEADADPLEFTEGELKQVNVTPGQLRNILIKLEQAYQ
ncbi:threonyl-tRNA synthetase [Pseudogymnoascus sp. 23342-1-I1]|nr:threonyl-tRNA synthetase [Pseudogymnoascus sp. 23342-1-I1]